MTQAGVLAALTIVSSARLAAQDAKPRSGPMSLDELNRDVRPRIRALAEAVFAEQEDRDGTAKKTIGGAAERGSLEADLARIRLKREIAELDLKEYDESTAKFERARIEAEVRIAEAAVRSAEEDLIEIEGIARKARNGGVDSVNEVLNLQNIETAVSSSRRSLETANRDLERARHSLAKSNLSGKEPRLSELKAEIAKVLAEDAALKQGLDRKVGGAEARNRAVERSRNAPWPKWTPVVKSLDELIGLAAELHSKLKAAPAGGAGGEAIAELSQRLRDSLAGAEELHDGLVFEAVGRRILDATAPARGGPAFERMRALSPADRSAVFLGAPEERDAVLKKAGFTEAEIRELVDGMERFRKK